MEDECKDLQSELALSKEALAKLESDYENLSKELEDTKEELQKAKKEVCCQCCLKSAAFVLFLGVCLYCLVTTFSGYGCQEIV